MSILKEFRDFAVRGNVIDLAVGIIIGSSFGAIVSSLVNDVLMPPLGMVIGNVDFSDLVLTLKEKTADSAAVVVKYGLFLNHIISFIIVAFAVFLLVKTVNQLQRQRAAAPQPAEPTMQEKLLIEIRDAIRQKGS